MSSFLDVVQVNEGVYNGFWTNWENGKISGATLTLPTYSGLVLVSFLTLFVQFSGGCFWRVICFMLAPKSLDIVVEVGPFPPAADDSSKFSWKGKAGSPFMNSLPLLVINLLHIGFFAAAGLLSSRVTTTASSGQALIKSNLCGFPEPLPNLRSVEIKNLSGDDLETFNAQVLFGRLTLTKSAAYARSCYNHNENGESGGCKFYMHPYLNGEDSSSATNASCPFGGNACAGTEAAGLIIARHDSGSLHSNKDLGINYAESDAITLRRVTTCAPIRAEQYATEWMDDIAEGTANGTRTSAKIYEFGKIVEDCGTTTVPKNVTNPTFCITKDMKSSRKAYTTRAVTAYHNNLNDSDFSPAADFKVDNADVTLVSIINNAIYKGNVSDTLFHAVKPLPGTPAFSMASEDLGVLGCTEQYEVCNLRNSKCTGLTGLYGIKKAFEDGDLEPTTIQNATFEVMWNAAWAMAMQWSFKVMGSSILLAEDWIYTADSPYSSQVQENQWQTEVENLHNLSLSILQHRVTEFASPNSFSNRANDNVTHKIQRPVGAALADHCGNMKIRSNDHYSVSVLGMGLILGIGSVLILLDWILIQQIFWWRSVTHHQQAKKQDWMATGTLQLQKLALEAMGVGPWDTRDYEVPVLVEKDRSFGGLGAHGNAQYEMGRVSPSAYPMTGYGQYGHGSLGSRTEYEGGQYSAIPSHGLGKGLESEVRSDVK